MNDRKMKNSAYLFDAIGNLDDSLIQGAQSPVAARAVVRGRRRRNALLAVAMAFVIVTTGAVRNLMNNQKSVDKAPAPLTLAQTLSDAADEAYAIQPTHIDFFDNQVKVIWQSAPDDTYYCMEIDGAREAGKLKAALAQSERTKTLDAENLPPYAVWLCYGDGTVVSPYLKSSPGNIGYGELFSYNPEIEPNQSFTSLLHELLST